MSTAGEPPVGPAPCLALREVGDRVYLENPARSGAWLSIDAEQLFDPVAVNDLP